MVHHEVGGHCLEGPFLERKIWDAPCAEVGLGCRSTCKREHSGVRVDGGHSGTANGSLGREGSGTAAHIEQVFAAEAADGFPNCSKQRANGSGAQPREAP